MSAVWASSSRWWPVRSLSPNSSAAPQQVPGGTPPQYAHAAIPSGSSSTTSSFHAELLGVGDDHLVSDVGIVRQLEAGVHTFVAIPLDPS